jgi:acyl-CoA thioester hydrolase
MMRDESRIRVRYKDTDQMGIVYYANYLVWFEIGRTELMRRLGMPYREFEKNNLYLPVIRVSCDYKVPARYDDEIALLTWIESLQEVRVVFGYEVRREEELLARGSTEHAFVNSTGRPVVLRKHSPFLWGRLCKAMDEAHGDKK